jgi:hypothetical protein
LTTYQEDPNGHERKCIAAECSGISACGRWVVETESFRPKLDQFEDRLKDRCLLTVSVDKFRVDTAKSLVDVDVTLNPAVAIRERYWRKVNISGQANESGHAPIGVTAFRKVSSMSKPALNRHLLSFLIQVSLHARGAWRDERTSSRILLLVDVSEWPAWLSECSRGKSCISPGIIPVGLSLSCRFL